MKYNNHVKHIEILLPSFTSILPIIDVLLGRLVRPLFYILATPLY